MVEITADMLGMLPSSHLSNPHPDPLVLHTPQSTSLVTLCSQTHKSWSCWVSAAPELQAIQCTGWPVLIGALQKKGGGKKRQRDSQTSSAKLQRLLTKIYLNVSYDCVAQKGTHWSHGSTLLCFPEGRAQWISVNKSRKYIQAYNMQQNTSVITYCPTPINTSHWLNWKAPTLWSTAPYLTGVTSN